MDSVYSVASVGQSENVCVSADAAGDYLLKYTVPHAEYMHGCIATAVGMLLGYYELYGYTVGNNTYDFSNLIPGTITINSRGSDGGSIYDMTDPSVLAQFIASDEYVERFVGTSANEEKPYTFVNGNPAQGLNVSQWNCLADYLGTGQYWRGNGDLSTRYYYDDLAWVKSTSSTYSVDGTAILAKYVDFKYGLDLYVTSAGYDLDEKQTKTYQISNFTFDMYMKEIDAGRPVLLSMDSGNSGHMVIGYGYNAATQEVIFDDTYRYDCRMKWNGNYTYSNKTYSLSGATTVVFDVANETPAISYTPGEWSNDYETALAYAKLHNVPILVYYGNAATCGYCQMLENQVFASDDFQNYALSGSVVLLKNVPISGLSSNATPTCYLLDANGNKLATRSGYGSGTQDAWMSWFGTYVKMTGSDSKIDLQVQNAILAASTGATQNATTFKAGSSLYFTADIKNTGSASSGSSFKVKIFVDGALVKEVTVNAVAAGGTYKLKDVALGTFSAGDHTWEIQVDAGYAILEKNEQNNSLTGNFSINHSDGYRPVSSALTISAGQTSSALLVKNGGLVHVSGTLKDSVISSGGTAYVSRGGRASNMVVSNSGYMITYSGTSAYGVDVLSGGEFHIYSSSYASDVAVSSGGFAYLFASARVDNLFVDEGGEFDLTGVVSKANVSGTVAVLTSGSMSDVTISGADAGVWAYSYQGVTLSNVYVGSGGYYCLGYCSNNYVAKGYNAVVSSGGSMFVNAPAYAKNIDVLYGGSAYVYGGSLDGNITVAGSMYVNSSTMVSSTVSLKLDISKRTVSDSYLLNGLSYFNPASSVSISVNANQTTGTYKLAQGASSFNKSISICNPTTCFGTLTVNGTALTYGGMTYSLVQSSGNLQLVISSGTSSPPVVSSGGSQVEVYSSGTLVKQGKVLTGEIISGGKNDYIYVSNGGTANSTTLKTSGTMIVYSGGLASNTTVSGYAFIYGSARNVSVYNGGFVDIAVAGNVSAAIMSGGEIQVSSGGILNNANMVKGYDTCINLFSGGRINGVTLGSGGHIYLRPNASATGIVASSGAIIGFDVAAGSGYLQGTFNGSAFEVKNANVSNYSISSGCHVSVCSGGTATNTSVLSAGRLYILSGGLHKGTLQLANACTASAYSGATIDFTVSGRTASNGYLINNLSLIYGAPTYTISISANQAAGTYKLAQGASSFNKTVSICNPTTCFGTLTVNGTALTYGGMTYSLVQNSGNLHLIISSGGSSGGKPVQVYSSGTLVKQGTVLTGETIVGGNNNSMFVSSGGTANSTTIRSSGLVSVYHSGCANNVVISSGGSVYAIGKWNGDIDAYYAMYASANNVTVSSGGRAIFIGACINNLFVASSGRTDIVASTELLYSMNTIASNVTVAGGTVYVNGADVTNLLVSSGGSVSVGDAVLDLSPKDTCSFNCVEVKSGGYMSLGYGDGDFKFVNRTVFGGTVNCLLGSGADILGELVFDLSERTVNDSYIVNNLANFKFYSGSSCSISISASQAAGTYTIASHASEFTGSITICNPTTCFGTLTVNGTALSYGGKTYSLVQSNGNLYLIIGSGGSSSGSQVKVYSSGTLVKQGTVLTGETIVSGNNNSMFVSSGGTASNTTVRKGGVVTVYGDGYAKDVAVSSGGYILAQGREDAENYEALYASATNVTVSSGGSADFIGAYMSNLLVTNGGSAYVTGITDVAAVEVYANLYDTEIKSGGSFEIGWSGVALWGTTVFGGTVTVSGWADVYGKLVFNLTERTAADSYIVDDLSGLYLSNDNSYTISISANQAAGTYKLAQGAADFEYSVTICNPTTCFGTLTVNGAAVTYGGMTYSLVQNSGNLQLIISSGGSARPDGPPISSGGSSGTILPDDPPVSSGGLVKVYSSGTLVKQGNVLTGETIVDGNNNSMFVFSGGTANSTTVNSAAVMYISSGGLASKTTLGCDGSASVCNGTAESTTINGGVMLIFQGGVADYITVNSGGGMSGEVYIFSGTVNSATVNSGSIFARSSGAVVNDTVINNGGDVCVYSGAVANDVVVNSGGYFDLWDNNIQGYFGGIANNTLVNRSGSMFVARSGIANSTTVWGKLRLSGGSANDTVVNSGGYLIVASTGAASIANDTIVNSGGSVYVYDTATVNNIDVNYGGRLVFDSTSILTGSHIYGGTVSAFGDVNAASADITFDVSQRSTADGYIINNLSYFDARSFSITVTANQAAGTYKLAQGASSFNKTVSICNPTTCFGTLTVNGTALSYGGKTYSLVQSSGNLQLVISSGTSSPPPVSSDNSQVQVYSWGARVKQGRVLTGETLVGGGNNSMFVFSGGTANSTTVNSAAVMYISSGGLASKTTLGCDGFASVCNGTAESTTINGGAMFIFQGGVADYITVNSGGGMRGDVYIYSGTVNSATVNSGRIFAMSNGAVVSDTTINTGGYVYIYSGASANNTVVNRGGYFDLWDNNTQGYYGGVANNTLVNRYGSMFVARSGIANSTTLWGELKLSGGSANDTVVNSGGYLIVTSNVAAAVANDTIVNSGGSVYVHSAVIVNDIDVNYGGCLTFNSGAILSGSHIYGGTVSAYGVVNAAAADITFDVSQRTSADSYIINNLSCFDANSYSITISASQTAGTYKLAQGASSFNKTVSICNPTTCFGTLTVNGAAVTYGGMTYSLVQNSGNLHLIISSGGSARPDGPPISSGGSSGTILPDDPPISSGGSQVQVYSSGTLVKQGTVLTGETIVSGTNNSMFVYSGGTANSTTVSSKGIIDVSSGGTANSTTLNTSAIMFLFNGGKVYDTFVHQWGDLDLLGGTAFRTVVSSATVYVNNDGVLSNTIAYSHGGLRVSNGGRAVNNTLSGGYLHAYSGAVVHSTIATSGGQIYILSSGQMMHTSLSSGARMVISSGGLHKGVLQIASGAEVSVNAGGRIEFTLTDRTTSDDYLINNLALVKGSSSCLFSIAVTSGQAEGTYKLAQGVSNFNSTVSICNPTVCLGTLTVNGSDVIYDGKTYSLDLNSGNLTLTIGAENTPEIIIPEDKWSVSGNFKGGGGVIKMDRDGAWTIYNASGRSLIDGDIPPSWYLLGAGDFDKDGYDGLLWQERDTGYVYMQNDLSDFDEITNKINCLGVVGPGYQILATGDFTGTGIAGALLQGPAFGDSSVSLNYGLPIWGREADGTTFNGWLGALVNTWQPGDALKGNTSDLADINAKNYRYEVVSVGDYNGDGVDDVMLQNVMPKTVNGVTITGSGDVFTFLTGDLSAVKAGASPTVAYAGCATDGWEIIGSGDFDGDGIDDVLLSDGTGVAGWKMANGQRLDNQWFGSLSANQEIAGIADLNNDGTDDILILDTATEFYSGWLIKNGALNGAVVVA